MEAIERIEICLRTQWANKLSSNTSNPHAFIDKENFKDEKIHHIRYLVFDLPTQGGIFKQRYAELTLLKKSSKNTYWQPVTQYPISSLETMQNFIQMF